MAIGRIPEPGTGIPESILDAKGDLISASAADTPARLAVGTNDQRLVAASGETTGLKWVADTQNTVVDAKGDLIVGTGADTVARLAVGTNGHTLVADSSETTGLKWQAPAAGGITSASARVDTEQSTTSTTFTDLTTSGPAVTLTTGTKVLVIVSAQLYAEANDVYTSMGYAVSGASSISAADAYALVFRQGDSANQPIHASYAGYRSVTAGSNTFTAKYKTGSSTSRFESREITVIDLGS